MKKSKNAPRTQYAALSPMQVAAVMLRRHGNAAAWLQRCLVVEAEVGECSHTRELIAILTAVAAQQAAAQPHAGCQA
jgi:hypothetical protein